ncbi:MAG: hypothetical protein HOC70_03800 [Gammaproteobacteria bacterium]|nr:hypothetical protein [Gammaproteobacteria bacterium]MBT4492343.1 hypothetical protein [Gammaproteobacteria bacterium]MBT7371980.1 hypothetical protein [Gammaproteobacteria bacterium]
MNWDALGAIGEIVGAIAVFLTLMYLAVQLKQNTASTQAATYSRTTEGWQDYLLSQSREDLDLIFRLSADHENLTNSEFFRAYYLCRSIFRRMEHDFYQYQAGTFDSGTWEAYVSSFQNDTFNNPGIRAMWALQSDFINPEFRTYIQPMIDSAEANRRPDARKRYDQLIQAERDRRT